MNKKNNSPVICSSEISQFLFCKVAWMRCRLGDQIDTKEMNQGANFHKEIANKIGFSRKLYLIRALLVMALFIWAFLWLWSVVK